MPVPVILIYDIGKTNKKLLVFDEGYQILMERSVRIQEIRDEDGFVCEDLQALTDWLRESFHEQTSSKHFEIRAVNFSSYGASWVHLNHDLKPVTPLYDYRKPFPEKLKEQFYDQYGGEELLAIETASPVLGSLNSGLQLYRLKYERPDLFQQLKYSLHLPQYLSWQISSVFSADISSVGCHTSLWHFKLNQYHRWVKQESLDQKFGPLYTGDKILGLAPGTSIKTGIGLHDSSAALIPYLASFIESFILISTGTWNISLNPFNQEPLTFEELQDDCLCYLSYRGTPVKASRLFAGFEHEEQVKRLSNHFRVEEIYYQKVRFNAGWLSKKDYKEKGDAIEFSQMNLDKFISFEESYHYFMEELVAKQVTSTKLIWPKGTIKNVYVDGGFGNNEIFLKLLARAFPDVKVYSALSHQASSLGAAVAIHSDWNHKQLSSELVKLNLIPTETS